MCHLVLTTPSILSTLMPNLHSLHLGKVDMTGKSFKCLKGLPKLHTLDMDKASHLTMGHMRSILSNVEHLSQIRLPDAARWMDMAEFIFFLSKTKLLFDRETIPAFALF
jgi:hypothetical protein